MPPDPFRPLDRVDPPDQWDEITRRAADDTVAGAAEDEPTPRRSLVRQPLAWAAAAAVALLATGTLVAIQDDASDDQVATDRSADGPSSTAAPASEPIPGPCPFTLEGDPDLPPLTPGRLESSLDGAAPAVLGDASWGSGLVYGRPVEVGVGRDAKQSVLLVDPGEGLLSFGGRSDPESDVIVLVAHRFLGPEGSACSTVSASVELSRGSEGRLPEMREWFDLDPAVVRRYVEEVARRTFDRLIDAVRLAPAGDDDSECDPPDQPTTLPPTTEPPTTEPPEPPSTAQPSSPTTNPASTDAECVDPATTTTMLPEPSTTYPPTTPSTAPPATTSDPLAASGPSGVRGGVVASGGPSGSRVFDYEVYEDPPHGLCVTVDGTDLGCDDVGSVLGPDADPATPRSAIVDCCSAQILYGYLPPGAAQVELEAPSGTRTGGYISEDGRIWAVPDLRDQTSPEGAGGTIVYRTADGDEVGRFPIGG